MLDQRNWDRLVAIGVTSLGILLIKEIVSTRLKKIFYHHVGTVHRIEIFPLKGAKGIAVDEALITSHGVQVNGVLDRSFVIYRPDIHEFRSCWHSETRKISKISVKILSSSAIEVSACGFEAETITPTEHLIRPLEVSGVVAENLLDCGDTPATWITNFFNNGNTYRIAYFDKNLSFRDTESLIKSTSKAKNLPYNTIHQTPIFKINLSEKSSLNIITKKCLEKASSGLVNFKNKENFENSVDNSAFRTNLVVDSYCRTLLARVGALTRFDALTRVGAFSESWCELVVGELDNYLLTCTKPIYGAVLGEGRHGVKYFDMCRNHAGLVVKRRVKVGDNVYAKLK